MKAPRPLIIAGLSIALLTAATPSYMAQGSAQPSDHPAKAAKKKKKGKKPKRRALDVEYKTEQISVTDEGGSSDVEFGTYSKLLGKPFGAFKPNMDEWRYLNWVVPGQVPRTDFSATVQVTFTASILGQTGRFKGFWNYSQDADGNILHPITGVITSGTGQFKGAGGRFAVLDLHDTGSEIQKQAGHWKGFIRY
jgi:hypothetical protein